LVERQRGKSKKWKRDRRLYWQDKYKLAKGCARCGYNKCARVLTFNHLDPSTKAVITKNGQTKMHGGGMYHLTDPDIPLSVMVAEWRKCEVLCFNCHMEEYHAKRKKGDVNVFVFSQNT
jgi:hypothetical protein